MYSKNIGYVSLWVDAFFKVLSYKHKKKETLTIVAKEEDRKRKDFKMGHNTQITSHSAYVATSTEWQGVKVDGFLYPNFM